MNGNDNEKPKVELTETQKKINKAKTKLATVKAIEKLEKEIVRLSKSIATKKAKIEELAEQL